MGHRILALHLLHGSLQLLKLADCQLLLLGVPLLSAQLGLLRLALERSLTQLLGSKRLQTLLCLSADRNL